MNDNLISKSEVLQILQSIGGCDATDEWSKGYDAAIDEAYKAVENIWTVELAERSDTYGTWYDVGSLSCRCSRCGCKNNRETPYCPICAAKMEEVENE